MNKSAESTGHESTSASVAVDHGTGASSSNNTGSVYDLPDTQWSDEDWEIWADVLRCSVKNKGPEKATGDVPPLQVLEAAGPVGGNNTQ